jgi:hypothetical protein
MKTLIIHRMDRRKQSVDKRGYQAVHAGIQHQYGYVYPVSRM